jgi:energy-coupling factor transport system permease protein
VTLLAYAGIASPLQRLHPLVKVVWLLVVVVLASITLRPVAALILLTYVFVITIGLGRIPIARVTRPMLLFLPLAMGYTVFNFLLLSGSTTLFHLGPLAPSVEGLTFGLAISLRVLTILLTAILFSVTTDPKDLTLSLIQNLKVPYRFGYALYVGLRFIPIATDEFQTLRAAHLIRGVGFDPGFRGRVREYTNYAVPLLATMIRKAVRVAVAMDSKGFGAHRDRTYLDRVAVRRVDVLLGIGLVSSTVAVWIPASRF